MPTSISSSYDEHFFHISLTLKQTEYMHVPFGLLVLFEDIDLVTKFGDIPRIFKPQQERNQQKKCVRPVETQIILGIRSVLRSVQSLRCPHDEIIGPYRRKLSLKKGIFIFLYENSFFAQEVFRGEPRKKKRAFFLG